MVEMTEKTQERLLSRKFLGQLTVAAILVLALGVVLATGHFTEGIFKMWLIALLADFGIYGATNVAGKFAPTSGVQQVTDSDRSRTQDVTK